MRIFEFSHFLALTLKKGDPKKVSPSTQRSPWKFLKTATTVMKFKIRHKRKAAPIMMKVAKKDLYRRRSFAFSRTMSSLKPLRSWIQFSLVLSVWIPTLKTRRTNLSSAAVPQTPRGLPCSAGERAGMLVGFPCMMEESNNDVPCSSVRGLGFCRPSQCHKTLICR